MANMIIVVDRLSTTVATNQYLQAYLRDGTFLWQMDMGYNSTNQYNIEPGASAISIGDKDNVTVYDLDGDGRAEVCVRTARGVILPDGSVITGPDDTTQYISILDGMTGKELARTTLTNHVARRRPVELPVRHHVLRRRASEPAGGRRKPEQQRRVPAREHDV